MSRLFTGPPTYDQTVADVEQKLLLYVADLMKFRQVCSSECVQECKAAAAAVACAEEAGREFVKVMNKPPPLMREKASTTLRLR